MRKRSITVKITCLNCHKEFDVERYRAKKAKYCSTKCNLMVDHIQPWAEYVELRFNMDNCRTLCQKCHYKITYGKEMPQEAEKWGYSFTHIGKEINQN